MRWTPEQLDALQKFRAEKSGMKNRSEPQAVATHKAARPRYESGKMNKTESAYAQTLDIQKRTGEIVDYKFEALKFRLAKKTFYTPDFFVVKHNGFEIHEVKGFWRDDARVKIKVAAEMFRWFKFVAVTKKKGSWSFENF